MPRHALTRGGHLGRRRRLRQGQSGGEVDLGGESFVEVGSRAGAGVATGAVAGGGREGARLERWPSSRHRRTSSGN